MKPQDFIEQIFEFEAESMLRDLVLSPVLVGVMFEFDDEKRKMAVDFIISILQECYNAKHLNIAVSHSENELFGYAMLFIHPRESSRYLHKIYVHEQFRGQGLGKILLNSVIQSEYTTALLCSADIRGFYEKNCFEFIQKFEVPNTDEFKLSKNLYSGLDFMANGSGFMKCPVFMLNDNDIREIMSIALGR